MKIAALQGLRALAAAMVVVYHGQAEVAALAARTGTPFTPSTLLPWDAGIDVFFVISGFIIVHAAAPLYGVAGGRKRFLAHRIARVVPLYWLVTAAYLALALSAPGLLSGDGGANARDPAYVAASFLFWPMARADGTPVPLFGLGWTLNCEMFFYLLFAVGLGWGRRPAIAWLVASLVLLFAARLLSPAMPMPLAFWTSPILLEFALGALVAVLRDAGLRLELGPALAFFALGLTCLAGAPETDLATRPVVYGLPAALLVGACVLARSRALESRVALVDTQRPSPPPLGEVAAERTEGAGPSLLVSGTAFPTPPRCARSPSPRGRGEGRHPLRSIESGVSRTVVALGDASYALYLTHPFVLRAGREALVRTGLAAAIGPWGALAILVILACLAALVVHRLVERPLTLWARVLLDPGPRAPSAKALDAERPSVPETTKRV